MGTDDSSLAAARDAIDQALGYDGLVDTAAVISNFQKMDRFADATGIPLDAATEMASRAMRAEIGLDDFGSAVNTPAPGVLQTLGAKVAGPLMPLAMKYLGPLTRRLAVRLATRLDLGRDQRRR